MFGLVVKVTLHVWFRLVWVCVLWFCLGSCLGFGGFVWGNLFYWWVCACLVGLLVDCLYWFYFVCCVCLCSV